MTDEPEQMKSIDDSAGHHSSGVYSNGRYKICIARLGYGEDTRTKSKRVSTGNAAQSSKSLVVRLDNGKCLC